MCEKLLEKAVSFVAAVLLSRLATASVKRQRCCFSAAVLSVAVGDRDSQATVEHLFCRVVVAVSGDCDSPCFA